MPLPTGVNFTMNSFWIPLYNSNHIEPFAQNTPKFNLWTMSFDVLFQTDFPVGSAFGNLGIRDTLKDPVEDMNSCIAECVKQNIMIPPYDNKTVPLCTGVVFLLGRSYYLKSGLIQDCRSWPNNNTTTTILYLI